jgi:hypothetical protein
MSDQQRVRRYTIPLGYVLGPIAALTALNPDHLNLAGRIALAIYILWASFDAVATSRGVRYD